MDSVSVVGLGYTGIPTAILFSEHFTVTGIQRPSTSGLKKIESLNNGELPFGYYEPDLGYILKQSLKSGTFVATSSLESISDADLVTINIQTPIGSLSSFYDLVNTIIPQMKPGSVLSLESTIPPGTTDAIIKKWYSLPHVVHVPERVCPGQSVWNLRNLDRIIGGDPESIGIARRFYERILESGSVITMSAIEAEVTKTAENAVRDVQIATANQLALDCERYGANFYTVKRAIDGLSSAGCGVCRAILEPGAGVGGHCLTKDSLFLEYGIKRSTIFREARRVNNFMPQHMFDLTPKDLGVVAVLGYSYKPDIDDDRESPTKEYLRLLDRAGIPYLVHDPCCTDPICLHDLNTVLKQSSVLVIFTAHTDYLSCSNLQDPTKLFWIKAIVDGRGIIQYPERFIESGIVYRGIGRGDLL